jgi:predicted phage-related endonuclease
MAGEDRSTFIGGSDIADLIGQPPWGCKRKIYYEKRGIPADFPFTGNRHTRRGQKLEAIAVAEYTEVTSRKTQKMGFRANATKPWRAVHVDRVIWDVANGPFAAHGRGVLEVKCPGREQFYRIRMAGLPLTYEMQLQWGMANVGLKWGSINIFHADSWTMIVEDKERDDEFCDLLLAEADELWEKVSKDKADDSLASIPEKLNPHDPRCKTCPWRTVCQKIGATPEELHEQEKVEGDAIERDETLAESVQEYHDLGEIASEAKKLYEEARNQLFAKLNGRKCVDTGTGKPLVYVRTVKMPARTQNAFQYDRIYIRFPKEE